MKPNEHFKLLMEQLTSKTITLDQMLLKCAEWTAEDIDEFKFKPLPARPDEMRFLDEVPEGQQNMLPSEFYYAHPQILNYARTKWNIEWENKALHDWLLECRRLLMQDGQAELAGRIDLKLKEELK
jgi:hypothetical protein